MKEATTTQSSLSAIHFLKDRHKVLIGLFRQLEGLHSRSLELKEGAVRELFMEWEIQSQIEQEIFYPAFHEAAEQAREFGEDGFASRFIEVHREIDDQVQALRSLSPQAENFDENLAELVEDIEDHFYEEETVMFPLADKLLKDSLGELGGRMSARQSELRRQAKYWNALPGVAQNPHGGEQMRRI